MSKTVYKPIISVIVPVINQADKTGKCFQSIKNNLGVPYELIWVDNGSSKEEYRYIYRIVQNTNCYCKIIRNKKNLGFVKAINQGIKEAKSKYVLLLNNDTEIGIGLGEKLIKVLERDPKIGAVGPVTDSRIGWQGIGNLNRVWKLDIPQYKHDVKAYSLELSKLFGEKIINTGKVPLSFFCCLLRREIFDKIGLLDPEFGIGIGDDDDYSIRLRANGYRQVLVLGAFCLHHHRTTFKFLHIEVDSLRRRNVKLLRKKQKEAEI